MWQLRHEEIQSSILCGSNRTFCPFFWIWGTDTCLLEGSTSGAKEGSKGTEQRAAFW